MRRQLLRTLGSCSLSSTSAGDASSNSASLPMQRWRILTRSSTMPSALLAHSCNTPARLPIALSINFSISPASVALRCMTSTSTSAAPISLAPDLSFCRARCSAGRRLMRAALIVGTGITPVRLMPRLTQSRKSIFLSSMVFWTSPTTSMTASIKAMMLPITGRLPATVLRRSSVT